MGILTTIVTGIGSSVFLVYLLDYLFPWLKYDWQALKALGKILLKVKGYAGKRQTIVNLFEQQARLQPNKTFLVFQDNNYSYEFMERKMNQVARIARGLGLKKGDIVAVLMENEPAFIWTFYGLVKVGVEPAFLNYNLRSKSLLHCFTVSGANILIVGHSQNDELIHAVEDIQSDLATLKVKVYLQGHGLGQLPEGFSSFDSLMEKASDGTLSDTEREVAHPRGTLCYIYTSGTTGLPKAAVVSHDKGLKGALMMSTVGVHGQDIIYTPLPLYHSAAGLIALGTAVETGATLVLRKKFSASHFWEDCSKHNVTVIQYIGELCRYLIARPKSPSDQKHKVRVAFGNGLRRDVWEEFQSRFNVPIIGEFYAATEGNAGFINHFNKTGCIGRASPLFCLLFPAVFVKYDIGKDELVRDHNGLCIKVKPGEAGLFLSKIKRDFEFDGYKGNKELSQKKIVCDVLKKGDRYFNSGDLVTLDEDYFVYFTDRIGDTFRWKGENVSTVEVSNVVADPEWIEDANVYGIVIPGQDGRAGMAAITLSKLSSMTEDHLRQLYQHCEDLLPAYARPRFLRFQSELEVTSTFKQRKVELVKEGFDPSIISDPLYCIDMAKKTYVPLDKALYDNIINGVVRL